ncbi:hypothetical protein HPP92_014709 [Vanilla planifolia]|uniref:Uncharacterized protein n=1 Tax=Vanilla planifolia TaxID=51239 RepID=A0A835USZ3_VANPL|nr:hypothetical protein HPP92_014709 [Vanilla planifolia]
MGFDIERFGMQLVSQKVVQLVNPIYSSFSYRSDTVRRTFGLRSVRQEQKQVAEKIGSPQLKQDGPGFNSRGAPDELERADSSKKHGKAIGESVNGKPVEFQLSTPEAGRMGLSTNKLLKGINQGDALPANVKVVPLQRNGIEEFLRQENVIKKSNEVK